MTALRLTVVCCLLSIWSCSLSYASMVIPSSFSAAHKTTYLQDNSPIESVLKVLSSFEIDSHIEIVLVGEAFTPAIVAELASFLKVLSDVAAAASPLKFVHEELVYHVSLGVGLERKIADRIRQNSHSVSAEAVGEVLGEFHASAATSTTIFVMHTGSLNAHTYSTKLPFCPQRTFLAKEGFALLDLSARALTLRSTANGNDHIISETEFPFLDVSANIGSSAMHTSIHDLATLIHRSGEAVVPFPIFSSDMALLGDASASTGRKKSEIFRDEDYQEIPYINEAVPVKDETIIDIVVFTLCMSAAECVDDADTRHAVENLLSELSGDIHNTNLVSFHFSADKDVHLAHAIHAATSYSSPGSSGAIKISSKELLFWMSSSKEVRKILNKQGRYYMKRTEMKKRILPVFVLKMPEGVDSFVLDGGKQVVARPFPEPAGGWLMEEEDKAAMFSLHRQAVFESDWPSSAVVTVRTNTGRAVDSVRSGLECGGQEVPRGQTDYLGELIEVIQAAIWGILPSHTHYSSSSRSLVQDYLWAVPPSMRSRLDRRNGDYSFRETRQIPRHSVIHLSDQIIGRFSDLLIDASSMRPAVNISSLLGLKEHKPNSYSRPEIKALPRAFMGKKEVLQVSVLKESKGPKGEIPLFEAFLGHLDLAATAFSHLEYTVAQAHLEDAAKVQGKLKTLVQSLLSMRSGSYTCKDMRAETKMKTIERGDKPFTKAENKHVKGENERNHETNRRWTWVFGILGSILIGCLIGYDVSTSKVKRALQ